MCRAVGIALALGFALGGSAVGAEVLGRPSHIDDWIMTDLACIDACSAGGRVYGEEFMGAHLTIAHDAFPAVFSDGCSAGASYDMSETDAQATLALLAGIFGSSADLSEVRAILPVGVFSSGLVSCDLGGISNTVARLLAIDARRLLVLAEGGAVLIFTRSPESR